MSRIHRKRHLAKTVSYRAISSAVGFLTVMSITGSAEVGAAFSIVELVYKPIQYYIHERIWYKYIKYGVDEEKEGPGRPPGGPAGP